MSHAYAACEAHLGGQSPDTLHDTVHDQCTPQHRGLTAGSRNNCKHGARLWNGMLTLFAMVAIMFLKLTSTRYSPYYISRRLYRVI